MIKEINRYIENNDMIGLRYIFLDCLDVDPTFEKYKEGYDRVKTIDGFFEDYVEIHPLIEEQEKWNEDYWIQLKNDLRENFSEKRFMHMRKVAKVYFLDKISKLQRQRMEEENKKLEQRIEEQRQSVGQKITEQREKNKKISCSNEGKRSIAEEDKKRLEQIKKELEEKNKETERHIQKQNEKVENHKKEYAGTQSKKGKEIALVLGIAIIVIIAIIAVLKMA